MSDDLIFFDSNDLAYRPVAQANESSGVLAYRAKPKGASNETSQAIELPSIDELARAMLIDGLPGRVQADNSTQRNYLRYGAEKLVRYQLNDEIAARLGIPARNGRPEATGGILSHFDFHPGFRRARESWTVEQTNAFVALARAIHEAGLDWYFVDIKPYQVRAGNKPKGRGSLEVTIIIEGSPPRMRLGDRAPAPLKSIGQKVPVDDALVAWATGQRSLLASRANSERTVGLWPDQYAIEAATPDSDRKPLATYPMATNLILYGPPGTGKTFATAHEAVRLCGEEPPSDREALMHRYRALTDEGRIAFVTFHQSMAYEEFVEGLRPTTDAMETAEGDPLASDGSTGPTFRLTPTNGIFKRISEKARLSEPAGVRKHLDPSRAVFKIALGERGSGEAMVQEGLDQSLIHLGWGGEVDWTDGRFDNFEAIKRHWKELVDPEATGKDANIETINALRVAMQIDDYVILSEGRDRIRAVGQVTGDYYFDGTASDHPHRRSVEWLWKSDTAVDREPIYDRKFRRHPIYQLASEAIHWEALDSLVFDQEAPNGGLGAPHVLVIDEINRANISKVFGELITLIEADKRLGQTNELKVTLPYSGDRFGVPSNLHIVATMNTADRSIALIDKALRRRFSFRELMPDYSVPGMDMEVPGVGLSLGHILRTINERIEYLIDREHQIGHAWLLGCRTKESLDEAMRDKIIPLIAEYFFEDWSKVADVLGGRERNAFLDKKKLMPPPGVDDETRHRWTLREVFGTDAYLRLAGER